MCIRDRLKDCARHLGDGDELPDRLVCSGMLTEEVDSVAAAFADSGLSEEERRAEGDWSALRLRAG